jgi:hypothetical protein
MSAFSQKYFKNSIARARRCSGLTVDLGKIWRTKMITRIQITLLSGALIAGVTAAWAAKGSPPQAQVLRGQAEMRQADGHWAEATGLGAGQWIRSARPETTIKVPGATVRLDKGASIKYQAAGGTRPRLNLAADGGRVYVHLDDSTALRMTSKNLVYTANRGEFVMDSTTGKVFTLAGDVRALDKEPAPSNLESWSLDGAVAVEGPDVRVRNTDKRRFTQGEENRGKRMSEDETPTSSPTYAPSASPTFSPPTQATPYTPPTETVTVEEEGGGVDAGLLAGALIVAGGGAYLIQRELSGDDDNPGSNGTFFNNVIFPTSP